MLFDYFIVRHAFVDVWIDEGVYDTRNPLPHVKNKTPLIHLFPSSAGVKGRVDTPPSPLQAFLSWIAAARCARIGKHVLIGFWGLP